MLSNFGYFYFYKRIRILFSFVLFFWFFLGITEIIILRFVYKHISLHVVSDELTHPLDVKHTCITRIYSV